MAAWRMSTVTTWCRGRLVRMTAPPISRYPVPKLEDLPEDIRARILEVQEKAGFVPNVFLTLAHRPDEFRAFFAYHDALMLKDGGLTKAEREMIVVATSGANDCLYCIVAHGAILRVYAKNPLRRRPGRDELPQGRHHAAAEGDARLRAQGRRLRAARSSTTTSRRCARTASPTRTSGTSARSPRSSRCRTGWRTSSRMRPNDEFYPAGPRAEGRSSVARAGR